ncbi:methyltransferase domain-containing protein [Gammaproteobacteria bacterium AB-CW1]|uniref:Methyltransferase domain-containing protein n=1 Tax=Natronospira elongata TaxID=3110268 RepID=A0AAP6JFY5_9GAMM|nr:methyltransferase domain-containing protein [Gammaproteobacteria bacterium AB-CW1]MEA5446285.1 methyltransferase domain-containing protein [Gammaproteobacteria bacterium AB-CW1]
MRRSLLPTLFSLLLPGLAAPCQAETRPDVGFIQTPEPVVRAMLEVADTAPGDRVLDLGSGDGRIPIMAAVEFGAEGRGIEIDGQLVKLSRQRAEAAGVGEAVQFEQGDLFEADLSGADIITLYLLPELNQRLKPSLLSLPSGTRIVSHEFDMGRWQADDYRAVNQRKIYFWRVPAAVAGEWRASRQGKEIKLRLEQNYQRVWGEAELDGLITDLRDVRLDGDTLRFRIRTEASQRVMRARFRHGRLIELQSAPPLSGFSPASQWKVAD